MLGMYIHTHWGYSHPYAARSWSLEDWCGYLAALKELGYDLVMFWPLLDSMPLQPTPSDQGFLARTAKVIDMAHRQFGMQVPGLFRGRGLQRQVRLVPAPGQIEEIGLEDGGLKEILVLADGGHHESSPGGPVFYFIE